MSGERDDQLRRISEVCLCLRSRMTSRTVTRRYNMALASIGLEVTEFSLLGALALDDAASVAELADRLAFERTTLVRNLKRMEDRGLIERIDGGGRSVRYQPTKEGKRLLRRAFPLWSEVQEAVAKEMAQEADSVLATLEDLRRAAQASD